MRDVELTALTGSPARLEDLAGTLARAGSALSDTCTGMGRVAGALAGQRSGAVDEARSAITAVRSEAELARDVLSAAASALRAHAGDLADHQEAALRAILRRDVAHRELVAAELDEAAAWRTGADPTHPQQADAVRMAWDARQRASQARSEITAAEHAWRVARDGKEADSHRAAVALVGLARVEVVRLAAAAGADLATFGASWPQGTALAGLLSTVSTTTGRDARAAARQDLVDALVAAGDDPGLWAAFWRTATPGELYLALGGTVDDDELASALRTGTAAWAASATEPELHAFGRAVVDDLDESVLGLDERSRLAALLLAPAMPPATFIGAADAWSDRRGRLGATDVEIADAAPLSEAIADGLSGRPEAALEYFARGGEDELARRVDAWFGQSPLDGWHDGGTAITGLFAAAVAGGTRDASTVGHQRQAALLASHVTTALVTGRGLLTVPTTVSDEASRHLAQAYEPYFVSFDDNVRTDAGPSDPGVLGRVPLADTTTAATTWSDTLQPRLDPVALCTVIGVTSRSDTTAGYWLGSTDPYLDQMAVEATRQGVGDGDPDAVAASAVKDVSVVAGATTSDVITVARRREARDLATIGAFSTAASVGTIGARPAVSAAAAGGGVLLPSLLTDHVGPAREEVLAAEHELRERTVGRLRDSMADELVEQGASAQEIADATVRIDPDSTTMRDTFAGHFGTTSLAGRRLGESP
ncbi:hypothetical protein BCE75_11187 [Isoptericola sp. CG 20/1183]|uniref:Uncharacterized protein n=1 Tax=Isoptericola halotolerans TaxID=300560 RepID=A0ABX5ELI5_9MICO|nr:MULTISPECIES: hypothetical protein [Isoptericola]PRZ04166.1 hypothetical protein BCE75_11187 [Isoptericola sp. CG 20/1183]PRZ10009.1 hypothetical protein BCL65_101147 [Isoptericola halotolerans]